MRLKGGVVVMTAMLTLMACQQREESTLTGTYGQGVVSGQVVMIDGGSPAGVTVGVRGTGISAVLEADGRFAFAGLPGESELTFERPADDIAASLRLDDGSKHVVIELARSEARRGSSKRRGVSGGSVVVMQFEGVIRSASATDIVVFTSKGVEQSIALAADTVIRKGKTILTPAALVTDARVHVKARKTDTGFSALLIFVQGGKGEGEEGEKPENREYEGLVVSATATQLVMTDSRGTQQTFVLDANTVIRKGKTPVLAAEIQPGSRVHVKATTAADGTSTATLVIVQNKSGDDGDDDDGDGDDGDEDDDGDDDEGEVELSGRVTAVSSSGLTVQADGSSVTVQTNASTKIEKRDRAILLTDIVVGDRVKVEGTRVDATTVLATEIEVR